MTAQRARHTLLAKRAGFRRIHVGVDVVSVAEVSRSLAHFGERYIRRVFTTHEAAYCRAAGARASAERFAARFAAKEATFKAVQPETPQADWRAIDVKRHASGRCDLVLHGAFAALAARKGIEALALSMTHDADHAVAVVVAHVAPAGRARGAQNER